ncbi:DNA-binding transcriptional response regulator [Pedobacter caeni]|uniref:Response regulator receiver domain-containing protein n=1 Tax=Pedobacter caeni TaxID=288992 RepID=A0A1M5AGB3_9SPHI|nr:response regulator [Pedobacter caeni]SHF29311.1 Response regulator receiver domain-containing protein [Pedobacter caeni]
MEKTVLIFDDEHIQNNVLKKNLSDLLTGYQFEAYSTASEIDYALENRFCTLVILNIRMDKSGINGIEIINKIFELNPIAHVLLMSPDKEIYDGVLATALKTGKIIDIITKEPETSDTAKFLQPIIVKYYLRLSEDISILNTSLLQNYSDAKNETDPNKKGLLFERFICLFFGFLGYRDIQKRKIDLSRNELDLSIRNETIDPFLNKFGKYILIECKNQPGYHIGKNDFIIFNTKLKNSNGLSELGIIATTGGFAKTTYLEAMRESGNSNKVLFLSNVEFLRLIQSDNKIEEFKKIIDEQHSTP